MEDVEDGVEVGVRVGGVGGAAEVGVWRERLPPVTRPKPHQSPPYGARQMMSRMQKNSSMKTARCISSAVNSSCRLPSFPRGL